LQATNNWSIVIQIFWMINVMMLALFKRRSIFTRLTSTHIFKLIHKLGYLPLWATAQGSVIIPKYSQPRLWVKRFNWCISLSYYVVDHGSLDAINKPSI
jgi:hypothetical protein